MSLRRWVVLVGLSLASHAAATPPPPPVPVRVVVPGFAPLTEERTSAGSRTTIILRDEAGREVAHETIGPNADGDLVRSLSADEKGIRRWQQTSGVSRCDGPQPLFLEHLDPKTRQWMRDSLPVPDAPNLAAHAPVPGPPPRRVLRFASGSTDGSSTSADALGAPRALDDGHDSTPLLLGSSAQVRGAFFTALAPNPIELTSIRVGPPPRGARLPAALVLIGGTPALPRARLVLGTGASWFVLPTPLRATCVSFVVDEPADSQGNVAIGEITLHASDDAPEALARLADSVAHDGAESEGSAHVLDRDPSTTGVILDELPTASPTGRRRLLQILVARRERLDKAELVRLVPLLATAHAEEREPLITLLSSLPEDARDPLVQLLSDPSQTSDAKIDALRVLAARPTPAVVPFLIDALSDEALTKTARSELARIVAQPATLPQISGLLAEHLTSLHHLDDPRIVRTVDGLMVALASSQEREVAKVAIESAIVNAAPPAPFAIEARALDALARLGDPVLFEWVGTRLRESADPVLRRVALSSLPSARLPTAFALYVIASTDTDSRVRERALQRLVEGGPVPMEVLDHEADDRWPQLRKLAYRGLGLACGGDASVLLDRRVFDKHDADPDADARAAALVALARCPGVDATKIASAIAKRQPGAVREQAAALLGGADPSVLPLVTKTLDKVYSRGGAELPDTAVALLRTIGRLGERRGATPFDDATLSILRDSAGDPIYPTIRIAALDALSRGCPVGTSHVLARANGDPEPAVQRASALAASRCSR